MAFCVLYYNNDERERDEKRKHIRSYIHQQEQRVY